MEHALVQLYQPQNHSLGCIPGLRTFSRRKLRRHGKGLGRNFLFEMPDNISVHDFKGPQHPREEKSAHQGTASSYSPWILFGACSQYYPSVASTTSSYFNYISTLIFFSFLLLLNYWQFFSSDACQLLFGPVTWTRTHFWMICTILRLMRKWHLWSFDRKSTGGLIATSKVETPITISSFYLIFLPPFLLKSSIF